MKALAQWCTAAAGAAALAALPAPGTPVQHPVARGLVRAVALGCGGQGRREAGSGGGMQNAGREKAAEGRARSRQGQKRRQRQAREQQARGHGTFVETLRSGCHPIRLSIIGQRNAVHCLEAAAGGRRPRLQTNARLDDSSADGARAAEGSGGPVSGEGPGWLREAQTLASNSSPTQRGPSSATAGPCAPALAGHTEQRPCTGRGTVCTEAIGRQLPRVAGPHEGLAR